MLLFCQPRDWNQGKEKTAFSGGVESLPRFHAAAETTFRNDFPLPHDLSNPSVVFPSTADKPEMLPVTSQRLAHTITPSPLRFGSALLGSFRLTADR